MRAIHEKVQALCIAAVLVQSLPAGAESVPPNAKIVIDQVHRAALEKNFENLREHMISEFTWSFGGDASAEQAINAWKKQPGYLRQLARVTKLQCEYLKNRYVECPVRAGMNFRAGFKATEGKWKLEYFVGGD